MDDVNSNGAEDIPQPLTLEERLVKLEQDYSVVWRLLNDVAGKHNSIVDGHIQAAIALLKKQGVIRDANPQE